MAWGAVAKAARRLIQPRNPALLQGLCLGPLELWPGVRDGRTGLGKQPPEMEEAAPVDQDWGMLQLSEGRVQKAGEVQAWQQEGAPERCPGPWPQLDGRLELALAACLPVLLVLELGPCLLITPAPLQHWPAQVPY